jgi:hypothetical protein
LVNGENLAKGPVVAQRVVLVVNISHSAGTAP